MRDESVDFARLNEAERVALGLLAQGHTAKSIATITGRSVGSVNERLREARRKTGVGSSRELARLFAAQENRDDLIGVADTPAASPFLDLPAASRGGRWKWGIAMVAILGGVLAAVVMAMQPWQADDPVTDKMAAVFMVPSDKPDSPRDYYLRLRAETPDERWAGGTEARLRQRYGAIQGVAADRLRVTCRASLCEVAGVQIGHADSDPIEKVGATLRSQGLEPVMTGMNNLGMNSKDTRFLVYLKRVRDDGAPQASDGEALSLMGTPFGSASSDPRALNDRFLKEARDEAWATATERALDARIAPTPNIGPIKVKCAATLCQVAGWIGPGDNDQINIAMRALQGDAMRKDSLTLGLDDSSMWFGGDKANPQKTSFVIFWTRKSS